MRLLGIDSLTMSYLVEGEEVKAVEDVTLSVEKGNAVGMVGESGCGKSSLAHTIIRLLPSNAMIRNGVIIFNGENILKMSEEMYRTKVRWKKISYVPQGSFNALNPVIKTVDQIVEALTSHENVNEREAYARAEELLSLVGIKEERATSYPHELSGGMKQRAVIAMALACNPELLIADEPTTALDVIVQAQIMSLLKSLMGKLELSLLLITHDISLATSLCDQIAVMYAGNIVENRGSKEFVKKPLHPYSKLLIDALPRMRGSKKQLATIPGGPPDLKNPPMGCKFHPRCSWARRRCRAAKPPSDYIERKGFVACYYPLA